MCPSAKCLSRFLLTSGSGPRLLHRCAGSGAGLRLRDKRVNPVLLGNGDLLASGMLVENLFACGTPAEATPVTASDLHSPATRPLPCDARAHTPGRRRLHCCMAGAAHLALVSCAGYLPVPTFLLTYLWLIPCRTPCAHGPAAQRACVCDTALRRATHGRRDACTQWGTQASVEGSRQWSTIIIRPRQTLFVPGPLVHPCPRVLALQECRTDLHTAAVARRGLRMVLGSGGVKLDAHAMAGRQRCQRTDRGWGGRAHSVVPHCLAAGDAGLRQARGAVYGRRQR